MKFKKLEINRRSLGKKLAGNGPRKGVEIGVRYGKFSKILCGANPELELKSIDPYKVIYNEWETAAYGKNNLESIFRRAKKLLAPYNTEIVRKTSMEAVRDFPYESLDFVYIDGSHEFDYVMCDIVEWGKRVKRGGIISGHDYCKTHWAVRLAVDAYAKAHEIDVVNLTEDATPSWWFERTW